MCLEPLSEPLVQLPFLRPSDHSTYPLAPVAVRQAKDDGVVDRWVASYDIDYAAWVHILSTRDDQGIAATLDDDSAVLVEVTMIGGQQSSVWCDGSLDTESSILHEDTVTGQGKPYIRSGTQVSRGPGGDLRCGLRHAPCEGDRRTDLSAALEKRLLRWRSPQKDDPECGRKGSVLSSIQQPLEHGGHQ